MAEPKIRVRNFIALCFKEAIRTTWEKSDFGATVAGIIIPILVHFVPEWEHAMSAVAWEIPLACLASIGATRLLLSPFLIYRKRDEEARQAESELDAIEQSKPNIVLHQPGAESVEQVTRRTNGRVLATTPFVKLRFVNSPKGCYPNSVARGVMARVKFYDAEGG